MDERGRPSIPRFDLDKGLEEISTGGGVTFAPDGSVARLKTGYAVGGRVPSIAVETSVTGPGLRTAVALALVSVGRQSWTEFGHTGVWKDDDGKIYVDAVDIITDKDEALAIATKRGEKAIFGFAEQKSFLVG